MVARRPRRAPRRAPRRGGRKAIRRVRRGGKKSGLSTMRQTARIVETIAFDDLKSDIPYIHAFSLSQFYRATTIAKNFQFYKAAKVKYEYMPLYNTFQESNNNNSTVGKPQMYFMMNREQNPYWSELAPADALFSIQSSGADPIAFTKNKEIVYTPNWCSPGVTALTFGTAQSGLDPNTNIQAVTNVISCGLKKQFGWLPCPDKDLWTTPEVYQPTLAAAGVAGPLNTAPNAAAAVVYNGHNLYIQQSNEPDVVVCKLVCTVEWLFKGPKNNYAANTPSRVTDVSGNKV